MKLLIKEFLGSLKERGELDAVLPDLLSEMGLHVYSRPAIGVRQNGVDLAAVGIDDDGTKKVFLFTVKAGKLGRADWNGSLQAVRPSLDEILDSYIPRRIPKQYSDLPVSVCICVGGDIDQNVDGDLSDYERRYATPNLEFQRWDGDHLANLLMAAVLSDKLLPEQARSNFRKAVALLDEPDAAYDYFSRLIGELVERLGKRQSEKVTFARQLNLCTWILYVWSRDADNLEAPYRCSELSLLWCWHITNPHLTKRSAAAKSMALAMNNLIRLHAVIANDLATIRYLPNAAIRDGLSTAVGSSFPLDVNLKLFELLGRVALTGIWCHFLGQKNVSLSEEGQDQLDQALSVYSDGLIQIINNNGILRSPIMDSHSIDIGMVCIFLAIRGRYDVIRDWTGNILDSFVFTVKTNNAYPACFTSYGELAAHPRPKSDSDYFRSATAGSTLIPTLVAWRKISDGSTDFREIVGLLDSELAHCTLQLWAPDETSEEKIYTGGDEMHGLAILGISVTKTANELVELIFEECRHSNPVFDGLSAVRLGHWPIILAACRHHRIPIPVSFWREFASETDCQ